MSTIKPTGVEKKDLKLDLDRMEIIEQIRHGNIYEVFAKSKAFKISDFHDFFAGQWKEYKGKLLQDVEIKATESSYHEPNMAEFPVHHQGATMSAEEGDYLAGSMMNALNLKAMKKDLSGSSTTATSGTGGAMSESDLAQMGQDTLSDWEQFLSETWSQILDAQMMSDYKSKMDEVEREVQRIIALVKQGAISPEFALIALAKVNAMKNGVLFTWLGKKAYNVNESLNKIANDLKSLSPTDSRYYGNLQVAQSKTREGAFQMQLLQTDMQKVMQDAAGTLENIHSIMGEMWRTRREIITKVAAH